jgi:hypothetical protein
MKDKIYNMTKVYITLEFDNEALRNEKLRAIHKLAGKYITDICDAEPEVIEEEPEPEIIDVEAEVISEDSEPKKKKKEKKEKKVKEPKVKKEKKPKKEKESKKKKKKGVAPPIVEEIEDYLAGLNK